MKVVFITGASKRLGAATATTLHQAGMNVIIHYHRSEKSAYQLKNKLEALRENSCHVLQADLQDFNSFAQLAKDAYDRWQALDVLVNNASVFYPTEFGSLNEDDWQKVMDTNVKAPLFLSQAMYPFLQKTNGTIINMVDIHGQRPLKDHIIYSVSKAALIMLTKALALETGLRVNGIAPGAILWPEKIDAGQKAQIIERIASKKTGSPQDIAQAVLYLTDNANYTTGQILTIDGGRTLTN